MTYMKFIIAIIYKNKAAKESEQSVSDIIRV